VRALLPGQSGYGSSLGAMEVIIANAYSLSFSTDVDLCSDGADRHYLVEIDGHVIWMPEEYDTGEEVGTFSAVHIRSYEIEENEAGPIQDWAEASDVQLGIIAKALFEHGNDNHWSEAFTSLFSDDLPNQDILVIRDLRLDPAHRGLGLSGRILSQIIEMQGYLCTVAAVIPEPMDTEGMDPDDILAAEVKLARRCEDLGFVRVPSTPVWVRLLDEKISISSN